MISSSGSKDSDARTGADSFRLFYGVEVAGYTVPIKHGNHTRDAIRAVYLIIDQGRATEVDK
jgi:hypothetical protein